MNKNKNITAGSVTRDAVSYAYRLLLDREPEDEQTIKRQMENESMGDLARSIIFSDEFMARHRHWIVPRLFNEINYGGKMEVDTACDPVLLGKIFERIEGEWAALGREDALWSVLSTDKYKKDRLTEEASADFYNSGKRALNMMLTVLERNAIDKSELNTVLEYGCGVGRVTKWLADEFKSVVAYDISRPHLEMARDHLKRCGKDNVELVHVKGVDSLAAGGEVDFVNSFIVLQHNPPPVIVEILKALLSRLNNGGVALFQVPTYRRGYSFIVNEYLDGNADSHMEMHVVPRDEIVRVVSGAGCQVLDILFDNLCGAEYISNTFLVRKGDSGAAPALPGQDATAFQDLLRLHAAGLVKALYRGLLKRDADPSGLAAYSLRLAGEQKLELLIADIVNSEEFWKRHLAATARANRHASAFSTDDLEREKLVFLHHPKSGGTTLHEILLGHFKAEQFCPERFNGIGAYPAGELARYQFFSGHFDLSSVKLIPGHKKIFTMLRRPADRLISAYYFLRAHRPQQIETHDMEIARLANKYSMADFFRAEEVRSNPWFNNSMVRLLTGRVEGYRWECRSHCALPEAAALLQPAVRQLFALDVFGIMERYEDSMRLIFGAIGWETPPEIDPKGVLEIIMDTNPGLHRIEKETVTREIRQIVDGLVESDNKLYRIACTEFEKRLASLKYGEENSAGELDK